VFESNRIIRALKEKTQTLREVEIRLREETEKLREQNRALDELLEYIRKTKVNK
jgi:hypothetical protein